MRALVTGAGGTVGTTLRARLLERAHDPLAWDRATCPVHADQDSVIRHIRESGADLVFHLAVASQGTGLPDEGRVVCVDWPTRIARACARLGLALVYTSTVMVWSDDVEGPLTPATPPDAAQGYGAEKLAGEHAVLDAHPQAAVVRLGWQIGHTRHGNQMVATLHQWAQREQDGPGVIKASTRWLPACSFLQDTADALARIGEDAAIHATPGGVYLLDANDRWSFCDIVQGLNATLDAGWTIEPDDSFVFDQRMIDPRVEVASVGARLGLA